MRKIILFDGLYLFVNLLRFCLRLFYLCVIGFIDGLYLLSW